MCRSTVRSLRSVLAAVLAMALVVTFLPGGARAAGDERSAVQARIQRLLHAMTLEEKVGQLFVPYVYGEKVDTADPADVTVVTTNGVADDAQQAKLVKQLVAAGKPVVAVAVRNPYDIAYYPATPTFLATYSYGTVAVDSLVRVLFGEVNPRGKLPVSIPKAGTDDVLYPFGHGLSYG